MLRLRLWLRPLAKATTPPAVHPNAHGGRPVADNPNLIKKQVIDRNGRRTTRYVRRDAGQTAPRRPAAVKPAPTPTRTPAKAATAPERPERRSAVEALRGGDEHTVTIGKVADGRAHIESSKGLGSYHLPTASVDHHFQELENRVAIDEPSEHREIEAVRQGKGKFLGRGEDGMAFHVGDKVVKVSTVTPYQRYNPKGFRTPEQAIRRLETQTTLMQDLREKDIPGIPEVEFHTHGDRGFQVQDFLDTDSKLTAEQLEDVQRSVRAMHKAGYTINDQIQVGIGKDGQPYHFDLGHAAPYDQAQRQDAIYSATSSDLDNLKTLYHENDVMWRPLGLDNLLVARAKPLLLSDKMHELRMQHEGPEPLRKELKEYFADLVSAGREDDDAAEFAMSLETAIWKRATSLDLDLDDFQLFGAIYLGD